MDVGMMQLQAQEAIQQGKQPPSLKAANLREARGKAQDFEAFFISQMLQPMFQGLSTDGPFGGGNAEAMWRGLQIDQYGKTIAKAGGIGIADAVLREMMKAQEAPQKTDAGQTAKAHAAKVHAFKPAPAHTLQEVH